LRERLDDGMIGCRGAERLEIAALYDERVDEGSVVTDRSADGGAELFDLAAPLRRRNAEYRIGTKRRNDVAVPARLSNRAMVLEVVGGLIRGREHFDVEPVEQCARPILG